MFSFLRKRRQRKEAELKLLIQTNALCRQILAKQFYFEEAFNIHAPAISCDPFFETFFDKSELVSERAQNTVLCQDMWTYFFPDLKNPFYEPEKESSHGH
jgi:hypothetical protein